MGSFCYPDILLLQVEWTGQADAEAFFTARAIAQYSLTQFLMIRYIPALGGEEEEGRRL